MPDKDSTIEKAEKAGKKLVDKLFGASKKAAKEVNEAPAKLDAEIKKQTGDDQADDSKGKDAGELGKKWEDSFHF